MPLRAEYQVLRTGYMNRPSRCLLALLYLAALIPLAAAATEQPFAIEVVDDQTGRGVPLVELTTTGGVTYVTDSAGFVAFDAPALIGSRVFFHVKSHGYEFAADGFGIRGVALDTAPGGSVQLKIKRLNIAERLYRVTGEGIYRDSLLLGRQPPIAQPLLNAQVTGCDSVQNAIYRGKLHWFWGDTNRPAYPLGLFHTSGAASQLTTAGGLPPARGINLEYFAGDDGFARACAKMPGDGPTWISGLVVLPDAAGHQRMLCGYMKVKPPMATYRRGIAEWDDLSREFRHVCDFAAQSPLFPDGHTLLHRDGETSYVYFATPYPIVRTRATAQSYCDLSTYESYTCLKIGSTIDKPEIDRDETGHVRYEWKRGTPPVGPQAQAKLVHDGKLKPDEGLIQLCDVATGKEVIAHAGSVTWNEFRKKFVMIAVQTFGNSFLGEVWYAEAATPLGPWTTAVKIVTHDKYSFYNPKQHPYFDELGGRVIYFEGTYSHTFSGNEHPTPRYDYNQIMHRLDLADERLKLP
jgi:hypothetical protein